jgi:pilus assembly protein CpaE
MAGTNAGGDPGRPTIAISLPEPERSELDELLRETGYETIPLAAGASIAEAFSPDAKTVIAVIDVAGDPVGAAERIETARKGRTGHLSVMFLVSENELDGLANANLAQTDELVLRPLTPDAIRWRVEAMAIRAQVPTGESNDAVLSGGGVEAAWTPAAPVFAVFNPKGGVGKTTIATNLAAVLQIRKHMQVLLIDADTVTGHVGLSLGLANGRSAADSWIDEEAGYPHESLLDLATVHSSGIKVVALSTNPLSHPTLKPDRVADAISEARHAVDAIVVDMHPSYSEVNLAVFSIADRIIVPVTPDLPAMRAAIQLKEVATEIGVRDRLAMIVNRANSGVTVADMEATVGLPAMAQIRSAGLHFVWSSNAGKTLIEKFPKQAVAHDFEHLADRLLSTQPASAAQDRARDPGSMIRNLFGRRPLAET